MNLRDASAADEAALHAFDVGDTSSPWLNEVAEIIDGLIAWRADPNVIDEDRRVVVAEVDKHIVAVAAHVRLTDHNGRAMPANRYLMVVAVRADQQRNGIATYLVESALAELQADGVRTVEWLVLVSAPAQHRIDHLQPNRRPAGRRDPPARRQTLRLLHRCALTTRT